MRRSTSAFGLSLTYQSMSDEALRVINRAAQGRLETAEAISWFERLPRQEQSHALRDLSYAIMQAHPLPADVNAAIIAGKVKPTFTPCVVLNSYPLKEALAKVGMLPENEYQKSFCVLLALFSIADRRRRETVCKNGCSHEWHDLTYCGFPCGAEQHAALDARKGIARQ